MMNKVIRLANLIRTTEHVDLYPSFRAIIHIHDCYGFTEDWEPIYVELPEAVGEIIALAKELGYLVEFGSDDV